jgi:phage terminase small subunit
MALTSKQQRFVDEYCVDLNATQAAIRAGYSRKTAYSIGSENLTKPEIKVALQANQAAVTRQIKITKEYLIEQAHDIMLKAKAHGAWSAAKGANELLAKMLGYVSERRVGVQEETVADPQAEEKRRQLRAYLMRRLEVMAKAEPLVIEADEPQGEIIPLHEWPR